MDRTIVLKLDYQLWLQLSSELGDHLLWDRVISAEVRQGLSNQVEPLSISIFGLLYQQLNRRLNE